MNSLKSAASRRFARLRRWTSFIADVVLDSSALIAMIRGEPGAEAVVPLLPGAAITTVNLAEVGDFYVREGADRTTVDEAIRSLPVTQINVDLALALDASLLFK